MSDTQSYKTVTFSLAELATIEFSLEERVSRLRAIVDNQPGDEVARDLLDYALNALMTVQGAM